MHDGQDDAPRLILLLGGVRSGKSAYAETLATRMARGRPVVFVATAAAEDEEMRQRIARHRAARPPSWVTLEAPTDPAAALRTYRASLGADAAGPGVVLLDCVTVLVANLLLGDAAEEDAGQPPDAVQAAERVGKSIDALLDQYREGQSALLLVSNEVGMGVVPPYPLGRVYRDLLGQANARLAREADVVLLLVAGLPVELKALAAAWRQTARQRYGLDL